MTQIAKSNLITFNERIAEVTGILATGILRRRKREMNQINKDQSFSDSGLDVSVEKSVHCTSKSLSKEESR